MATTGLVLLTLHLAIVPHHPTAGQVKAVLVPSILMLMAILVLVDMEEDHIVGAVLAVMLALPVGLEMVNGVTGSMFQVLKT